MLSILLFIWASFTYHWVLFDSTNIKIKKQEKTYDDTETFAGRFWFVITLIAFLTNLCVVTTVYFWKAELLV